MRSHLTLVLFAMATFCPIGARRLELGATAYDTRHLDLDLNAGQVPFSYPELTCGTLHFAIRGQTLHVDVGGVSIFTGRNAEYAPKLTTTWDAILKILNFGYRDGQSNPADAGYFWRDLQANHLGTEDEFNAFQSSSGFFRSSFNRVRAATTSAKTLRQVKAKKYKLSWNEYVAVAMWTMMTVDPGRKSYAIYSQVNDALASKGLVHADEWGNIDWTRTQAISVFLYHFSSALTKLGLSTYPGPLYRWQGHPELFPVGKRYTKSTFGAATVSSRAPAGFASEEVVLMIYGAQGYKIGSLSLAPTEKEVLLPPGTSFVVDDVQKQKDGKTHVVVKA